VLLAVTCPFKFTVLYFLIVHLLERSADRLSLAPLHLHIHNLSGTELGPHCLISCDPDTERLRGE